MYEGAMYNPYTGIHALYATLADVLSIYFANKWVNIGFRFGFVSERKQLLTHFILLKRVHKTNLSLVRFGLARQKLDAPEFALLIGKCRSDTLRYLRHSRKRNSPRSHS